MHYPKCKHSGSLVAFCGLNPSTATEDTEDNTVRRCIRYAANWGHGGMYMLNLYGLRSTDPKGLYDIEDPIGPGNNEEISRVSNLCKLTVCAWGICGVQDMVDKRAPDVLKILKKPHCLKLTKNGYPRHPLYLRNDLRPIKWLAAASYEGEKELK